MFANIVKVISSLCCLIMDYIYDNWINMLQKCTIYSYFCYIILKHTFLKISLFAYMLMLVIKKTNYYCEKWSIKILNHNILHHFNWTIWSNIGVEAVIWEKM